MFETKDSGEREEFETGMVRDTQKGKPRYDLIPTGPLTRLAERIISYKANSMKNNATPEELAMFAKWVNGGMV